MSKTRLLRYSKIPALKHSTKASPISKGVKACSLLFLQTNFVIKSENILLDPHLSYRPPLSIERARFVSPRSPPFSRLNYLNSLSLFSLKRCSSSPNSSVTSSGFTATGSHPYCAGGPDLDTALQVGSHQSRGGESPLLPCWPVCFSGSPAMFLPAFILLFWFLSHLLSKHLRNLGFL